MVLTCYVAARLECLELAKSECPTSGSTFKVNGTF
jgi:hypothetical protein